MQKTEYAIEIQPDRHGHVAVCREMDLASAAPTAEEASANLKEIIDLRAECADVAGLPNSAKARQLAGPLSKLDELKRISLELFDSVRFEIEVDPEIHETFYLAVTVTAAGEPREVVDRQLEWHRRTMGILQKDCHNVVLLIDSSK